MCVIDGKTKKKLLYVNVGVYGILNAVEYSVVLPTLWLYISSTYDSPSWYFGLCLSGFHMSSLLFAPLFGFVNDCGVRTKTLVMFANLFQILGSILYLVRSEWLVFSARFVAGIGSAVGSLLYADVNRVTTVGDRTSVLAVLMLCRQVGLFVGPAFNLFLAHFDFDLGPLYVDKFTAPGFLMTVLWLIFQIFMGFSYYDVDQLHKEEEENGAPNSSPRDPLLPSTASDAANNNRGYGSIQSPTNGATSLPSPPSSHTASPPPPLPSTSLSDTPGLSPVASPSFVESAKERFHSLVELSSESVVVLLAVFFVSYFAQMTLETMVTPITAKLFGFGELENALVYAIAGVVIFVVCIVIMVFGRKSDDRLLTLLGLVSMLISVLWAAIVLPSHSIGASALMGHFIGSTFFDIVGLTIVCITSMSLYSKLLPDSMQGLGMGVRRATISLALILGPLWAGSLINRLNLMLFTLFGLLLVNVIMFIVSYARLRPSAFLSASDHNEAV